MTKATALLRAISQSVGSSARHYLHALSPLFRVSIVQPLRAKEAVRSLVQIWRAASTSRHKKLHPLSVIRLSQVIREHGQKQGIRRASSTVRGTSIITETKSKVSVIAWDVGHNAVGRAYLLADLLRDDYDVEVIGTNFPRFGTKVWEPLRICSRVALRSFPGRDFPQYFRYMEEIAEQIEGDVIYVSKPRLPSMELAILAKLHRNRPVILDVDDYELGFFNNRQSLTLDETKKECGKWNFYRPYGETWTRYSESLIPLFDKITVSNEELRKRFGGMILPHVRDEHDFTPMVYLRDTIRAELGFTGDDRVVLFAGTPRMHKGFMQVADALKSLNHPNYKLLVVGSPVDRETSNLLKRLDKTLVATVSYTPFCDLPGYLCVGDLICLIQDERCVTSSFQMPAKFTDGLSMEIPMLASNVPVLENLAKEGLVELLGGMPLEQKIDEIFSNYEVYKRRAVCNREVFLQKYSYGANRSKLKDSIDFLLNNPAPVPGAFRELVAYHREIFAKRGGGQRVTTKLVAGAK